MHASKTAAVCSSHRGRQLEFVDKWTGINNFLGADGSTIESNLLGVTDQQQKITNTLLFQVIGLPE